MKNIIKKIIELANTYAGKTARHSSYLGGL
jgi:hypothetical protein